MAVRVESQAEPIPGYKLIERLGGGGFGEVWKVEAPGGIYKAIKFVFGDLRGAGDDGQRAEQELKALARVKTVRHPYILSLERYDIIDGQLLIVMELAECNLWDRYRECRAQGLPGIPRDELLRYMEESAEALDLMNHEYQLQHLDIKPQNLFIVHQHIKVADFGLVKDLEGSQASVTGGVTPVYAAPETFDGYVSRFSDQYSLAIVFQELLTGQRPFTGNNVRHLIMQHMQAAPNVTPLPGPDQPVIARSLAKVPDKRYPNCRDMVAQLRKNTQLLSRKAAVPKPEGASNGDGALADSNSGGTALIHTKAGLLDDNVPAGTTHFLRALQGGNAVADSNGKRKAAAELHGDGALFPAFVIGLGQLGLTVLQRLREQLTDRVERLGDLPQLRTLLIDTDPEVVRSASRGATGLAFSPNEFILAPLNRPSYYLKPRDGRPACDTWINQRMLYRIPRSQVTTGVRALGRLAFCDNYRAITRRLQEELTKVLEPQQLTAAAEATGLGVRSNRPRVYVIASLAGGTGSGMYLDLAYTLRSLLKQQGFEQPDVIGLLLVPVVERNRTRTLTLGNACAALTELEHYAATGTRFSARYHEREPALEDAEPPFTRTVLLPLPDETDEQATRETVELAGQYLARDLITPLGRAADLARADQDGPAWRSRGLFFQNVGLFTLRWPRRELLEQIARVLCQRLVQRWMSKDSKPVRDAVQRHVQEQWAAHGLGADKFIARLRTECRAALGQEPEAMFTATIGPLAERVAAAGRKGTADAAALTPDDIAHVLEQYAEFLGKPDDAADAEQPALLPAVVRKTCAMLVDEWSQKLAEVTVHLIEEPIYRLAGAEEAVRQAVATLEQAIQAQENLGRDMTARAEEAYTRLQQQLLPGRAPSRKPPSSQEILELLRLYPKWRLNSVVLQHVTGAFVSLRGHLSDELREVNFCRVRLGELQQQLQDPPARRTSEPLPGVTRLLYPVGCKGLNDAADQFLAALGDDHLNDLDVRVEAMLKEKFTALVHVCLTSANVLKEVEVALLRVAVEFAGEMLPSTDVAEFFLEHYATDAEAMGELESCYAQAEPEMPPPKGAEPIEIRVLAAPAGPAGDRVRALARQALPEVQFQHAVSDDIVFYRERIQLPLAEVEQLGPVGQDAYRQMASADHFTPHTRSDVNFARR